MSKTPTCLVCRAKFSMDPETLCCKNCGAPQEASRLTPSQLRQFRIGRRMEALGVTSKRALKRMTRDYGGSKNRRRPKHGRQYATR